MGIIPLRMGEQMSKVIGKGFDPTRVSFTPKWFIGLVVAVMIIMAGVGVGTWAYGKVKDLLPTTLKGTTAGDTW